MTDSIIERAARAMCGDREPDDKSGGPHPLGQWLDEGEAWWMDYAPMVRAVLEAVREPSENMVEIGGEKVFSGSASAAKIGVRNAWKAMIDAALEEG